ncbi:hypothetical protein [Rhizohabitans arisaemae]|uniref:hypothetical protein n=1 Tax=Rhizohabitans arisaemae TaxID=2720610 RepID=UPI0024B1BC1B|nr:hypothetical protein [Rhizohabitans arisaemae]
MSEAEDTERYLKLTVELTVEVLDVDALQAAAMAAVNDPEADLDEDERREQLEEIRNDDSGAAALQWLIDPEDVLALVDPIDEVDLRVASLGVEAVDEPEEEEDDDEHDHSGHAH